MAYDPNAHDIFLIVLIIGIIIAALCVRLIHCFGKMMKNMALRHERSDHNNNRAPAAIHLIGSPV